MKVTTYAILGTLTAPLWVPAAFLGYVGFRAARFAFKNPNTTVGAIALSGLLWYAATSDTTKDLRKETKTAIAQKISKPTLEHKIEQYPKLEEISHPDFNFYYVKVGDTLSSIARKVSGTKAAQVVIARDNNIAYSKDLTAGQLLKIRKLICLNNPPDVYSRVPKLAHITLPNHISLLQYCNNNPVQLAKTLELNRRLGLNYTNEFPYEKRIIYYR